ncbi:hypothetical protein PERCYII10_4766 [Pseudomonas aeruginosa]|nr:hypothetical protein PERCYII10_4766 [Pseudomonas aeruginosa]
MTLISHDERLIKALAVAIVDRPRATLKELAEAAGVSKATLHRFCGTRDNLVQMLEDHGETVLNQIIQACDLEHAEPLEASRNTSPTASCWYSWYSSTARTSSTRTVKAHAGSPTWKRWTPSSCADSRKACFASTSRRPCSPNCSSPWSTAWSMRNVADGRPAPIPRIPWSRCSSMAPPIRLAPDPRTRGGAPLVAAWHGPIRVPSTSAARRPARHSGRSVLTGPATKCLDSRKGP